jgi:hypothetical protein
VRLALFAEMVKGKAWTPATLRQMGGTEGVGVTFLEETFAASTAPPPHRLHRMAAQALLKALLPEAGSDIKGHLRSRQELLEASGNASRPRDFDELLHILDSELRLITPTDPEGLEGERSTSQTGGTRHYQLTHDYVVPSLREWLTRQQKETMRGRAELRLANFTAEWNAFPADRYLPRWWEWANIRLLTRKRNWTPPQRRMMRRAGRYHIVRGTAILLVLVLLGWGGVEANGRIRAYAFRRQLLVASPSEVPHIVAEMGPYRRWADPLLRGDPLLQDSTALPKGDAEQAAADFRKVVNLRTALLPVDERQIDPLCSAMLEADSDSLSYIRASLEPYKAKIVQRLWSETRRKPNSPDHTGPRELLPALKSPPVEAQPQAKPGMPPGQQSATPVPREIGTPEPSGPQAAASSPAEVVTSGPDGGFLPDASFHAAAALAKYDPGSPEWETLSREVAKRMVFWDEETVLRWRR